MTTFAGPTATPAPAVITSGIFTFTAADDRVCDETSSWQRKIRACAWLERARQRTGSTRDRFYAIAKANARGDMLGTKILTTAPTTTTTTVC